MILVMIIIMMSMMFMTMLKKIIYIRRIVFLPVMVMTANLLLFPAPLSSLLLHDSVCPVLLGHPAVPRLHDTWGRRSFKTSEEESNSHLCLCLCLC